MPPAASAKSPPALSLTLGTSPETTARCSRGETVDMKRITTRAHALMDYMIGTILVLSPFLITFPDNPMKQIAFIFGAVILGYSAMTDYVLGIIRMIPFPIHRGIDLFAGGGLIFAPIHFAVHGAPAVLFVVLGAFLLSMAFLTRSLHSPGGHDHPVIPGS